MGKQAGYFIPYVDRTQDTLVKSNHMIKKVGAFINRSSHCSDKKGDFDSQYVRPGVGEIYVPDFPVAHKAVKEQMAHSDLVVFQQLVVLIVQLRGLLPPAFVAVLPAFLPSIPLLIFVSIVLTLLSDELVCQVVLVILLLFLL